MAATLSGVSPVKRPTPALSNAITGRSNARAFTTAGSHASMLPEKSCNKNQWRSGRRAELAIGEAGAAAFDVTCGRGFQRRALGYRYIEIGHVILRLVRET